MTPAKCIWARRTQKTIRTDDLGAARAADELQPPAGASGKRSAYGLLSSVIQKRIQAHGKFGWKRCLHFPFDQADFNEVSQVHSVLIPVGQ